MANAKKKSWKTTLAGIASVLVVILTAVSALFDGNPDTVPQWDVVIASVTAAVGLFFARDNDVSSEDAGAK